MIYEWLNLSMKYADYGGKTEKYERMMCWNDSITGVPLVPLEEWEPPTLVQYLGEEGKERKPGLITDVVKSGLVNLISEKAKTALSDIWEKHATLYPVILDDSDEPYYMVVVHTVIDCIDREKSKGSIQKYGKNKGKGYFARLDSWVFREEDIGDNELFVLPDDEVAIYVTDIFKQRVIEANLEGFAFRQETYEETPFIS